MGITSTPVLDLVISGATVASATTPINQAHPATPDDMRCLLERAWVEDPSGRLAMALWVAWKTASRWDRAGNLVG
jgi:hypothetical protein